MPRTIKTALSFTALAGVAAIALSAPLLMTASPAAADKEKALSRADVQEIVKDYLQKNPEVITDALKAFQIKQQAEAAEKSNAALKSRSGDLYSDTSAPVLGNPKGDVTLVEFFDYHCGYCKKVLPDVTKLIGDDKQVRVVFKEFPILSPDSELAAKAALAVYHLKPEKYFDYHTALMKVSGKFDEDVLTSEATKLGVDAAAFKAEMNKKEVADEIAKNRALGSELGIQGTPAFIVNGKSGAGKLAPGAMPYEALKQMVKDARNEKPAS